MAYDPAALSETRAAIQRLEVTVARQTHTLARLLDDASNNHAAITALIALGQALVESHPKPTALARSFLDQIDLVGSVVADDEAERYRADIQKLNALILDVVNRGASL